MKKIKTPTVHYPWYLNTLTILILVALGFICISTVIAIPFLVAAAVLYVKQRQYASENFVSVDELQEFEDKTDELLQEIEDIKKEVPEYEDAELTKQIREKRLQLKKLTDQVIR